MNSHHIIFLTLAIAVILGCQRHEAGPAMQKENDAMENTVPLSRLPLFANLNGYAIYSADFPATKSEDGNVTIGELIDFDSSLSEDWKDGISFTQLPFLQNEEDVYVSVSEDTVPASDNLSKVKKYLISKEDGSNTQYYVVTLIPDYSYYASDLSEEYDFLTRPGFTGAALFSDLSGRLIMMRAYLGGQVCPAEIIPADEHLMQVESPEHISCVALYADVPTTKTEGGQLKPSYCFSFRYRWINPSYCIDFRTLIEMAQSRGYSNFSTIGSGGGNIGQPAQDSYLGPPQLLPDENSYTIDLSVCCSGTVTTEDEEPPVRMIGAGTYTKGTIVVIDYEQTFSPQIISFSYWTGGFSDTEDEMPFVHKVQDDIESTACFNMQKPCTDKKRGITNPLMDMSIAASGQWGNYLGGTFGKTRNGGKTRHDGIDLLAPIGTPVYAMYSGIISKIVSDKPDVYERGSYGNEIDITSCKDDLSSFTMMYCHLQSNHAVAVNPRTGAPFAIGDRVYRGDLIGHTGRSGNAFKDNEVPNKHLHIGVVVNGKHVNPANYINGTINTKTIQSAKGKIDDIKCDK